MCKYPAASVGVKGGKGFVAVSSSASRHFLTQKHAEIIFLLD